MKATFSAAALLSDLQDALPACAQCGIRDGVPMRRGKLPGNAAGLGTTY